MRTYILEREQIIERPRAETFAFFADALNLERITPPFLRFRIITPLPIEMGAGTEIEYRLRLFGVRFRWLTVIDQWRPEEKFVDIQLSGPYSLWHHTHIFEKLGRARTLMRDRVLYQIPYGLAGTLAHRAFVRKTLDLIFDYRTAMISRLLAPGDGSNLISFPRAPLPNTLEAA
jgi:ligand-binding SRPBCC domain-containing protein